MLRSAKTGVFTSNHDGHLGRQGLSLFHGMGGQDHSALLPVGSDAGNNHPHETTSFRIHPGGGFVQKDNGRISNHSDRDGEFSFVATRQVTGLLLSITSEIHLLDFVFHKLVPDTARNTLEVSVKLKMLFDGNDVQDGIKLGTIANIILGILQFCLQIVALNMDISTGGSVLSRQHLESGGLSGTVYTEQTEHFSFRNTEGDILNGCSGRTTGTLGVHLLQVITIHDHIIGCRGLNSFLLLDDIVIELLRRDFISSGLSIQKTFDVLLSVHHLDEDNSSEIKNCFKSQINEIRSSYGQTIWVLCWTVAIKATPGFVQHDEQHVQGQVEIGVHSEDPQEDLANTNRSNTNQGQNPHDQCHSKSSKESQNNNTILSTIGGTKHKREQISKRNHSRAIQHEGNPSCGRNITIRKRR
mmetsp:Transcript_38647/g.43919  ORF Transcript_38647/g.43919 Transcript_38647/m.43919 type:complete len:413 (+) Transcript_38647:1131-2369(+)